MFTDKKREKVLPFNSNKKFAMITEDSISDHNEKKPISEEVSPENLAENPAETETVINRFEIGSD